MFYRLKYAVFFIFSMISAYSYAVPYSDNDYSYHSGDYNKDGAPDIILVAKKTVVPIPYGDLTIPILLPKPHIILIAQGNGSYVMQLVDGNNPLTGILLSPTDYRVFYGDFNGDGHKDLFLQAPNNAKMSLILYGSSDFTASIGRQMNAASLNPDPKATDNYLSSDYATIEIADINRDGKSDIITRINGIPKYTIYGSFGTTVSIQPHPETLGKIEGSFSVSERGSAEYTVPIHLPSGVNNLTPTIAVRYDSQSSNGEMGLGWSLSAGSTVSRCSKNLEIDGVSSSYQFLADDVYCLDGQRLLGGPSTFRKMIDDQTQVNSMGILEGGANHSGFSAFFPNGLISTYGTFDAKLNHPTNGKTAVFRVKKTQDRYGNTITYRYETNSTSGVQRLIGIDYSQYTVGFEYEGRGDIAEGFLSQGVKSRIDKRLNKIVVKLNNGQVLYSYQFTYQLPTQTQPYSLLDWMQYCNANNVCLKKTVFGWNYRPDFQTAAPLTGTLEPQAITQHPLLGDFNGDGKTDALVRPMSGNNPGWTWRMYYGSAAGLSEIVSKSSIPNIADKVLVGDFNGDGRSDIFVQQANSAWSLYAWSETAKDFVLLAARVSGAPYSDFMYPGDFNGDGLTDILQVNADSNWIVWLSKGAGFTLMPAKQTAAQSWKYIPGDYNGDGKTDIVTASPDGFGGFWHLFVFNGSNFDKTTQGALPSYPNINTLGDITK